jgi:hypothetical protein
MRPGAKLLAAGVGLIVLGLSLVTGRGALGGGQDEEIPFLQTANLAAGRGLAFDDAMQAEVARRVAAWQEALPRGRDGRWQPVFGPAQPLACLPLYFLGHIAGGGLPPDQARAAAVRWVLGFNPLLTALTAALLTAWLLALGLEPGWAVAGGLAWFAATPAWPYAKSLLAEPLAALAFAAALLAGWRARGTGRVGWALAAGLALAAAMLARPHHIVLAPVVLALAGRTRRNLLAAAVPVALAAMWWVGFNLARFGRPLDFGYLPTIQGDFSVWALPVGLLGQLLSPGRGLVWYAPPLLLGFWGWRELRRAEPALAWAVVAAGGLVLGFYSLRGNWVASWCWGPRYLVPVLPLLALPAVYGARRAPRAVVIGLVAFGLLNALAGLVVYNGLYQDFILRRDGSFRLLLWDPLWAPWVGHWRLLGRAPVDLLVVQMLRVDPLLGLTAGAVRLAPAVAGTVLLRRGWRTA